MLDELRRHHQIHRPLGQSPLVVADFTIQELQGSPRDFSGIASHARTARRFTPDITDHPHRVRDCHVELLKHIRKAPTGMRAPLTLPRLIHDPLQPFQDRLSKHGEHMLVESVVRIQMPPASFPLSVVLLLALLIWTLPIVQATEPIPLAEAAEAVARTLEVGEIVTADWPNAAPASAGRTELPSTPPDRRIFEIGSVSKVFTGLLYAIALERHTVSPETTLADIYRKQIEFSHPDVATITLQQLATHTSGLPRLPTNLGDGTDPEDPYAHFDVEKLAEALAAQELSGPGPHPPDYSNYGMGLLGHALSDVAGKPWETLVQDEICEPLGLADTTVELDADQQERMTTGHDGPNQVAQWQLRALAGAGALRSTAADLVKFGRALLIPSETPLQAPIRRMLNPSAEDPGIGLGILLPEVDGKRVLRHGGGTGGYQAFLEVRPGLSQVRVILMNNAQPAISAVFQKARGEKARRHDSDRTLAAETLEIYTGVYEISKQARVAVLRDGDHLLVRLTGQPFARVYPHEQEDRFFYKIVSAELQFEREADEATRLVLHQNGIEQVAHRIDAPLPAIRFPERRELDAFAGRYMMLNGAAFEVEPRGKTLFVKLADQPALPVFAVDDDTFEYDVVEAKLVFHRDKSGTVTALTLHQNGMKQPAVRVKDGTDEKAKSAEPASN